MVHSAAIWHDGLTCKENVESSKAKRCNLTLFKTYARRLPPPPPSGCANGNIDLTLLNKLHELLHYKIGITCVYNRHVLYSIL